MTHNKVKVSHVRNLGQRSFRSKVPCCACELRLSCEYEYDRFLGPPTSTVYEELASRLARPMTRANIAIYTQLNKPLTYTQYYTEMLLPRMSRVGVSLYAGHAGELSVQKRLNRSRCRLAWVITTYEMGAPIGATWRTRLKNPCSAAMWHSLPLLWRVLAAATTTTTTTTIDGLGLLTCTRSCLSLVVSEWLVN